MPKANFIFTLKSVEVKIIFSKRKSLGLQVSSKGVFVRAPMKTPMKYINQLLGDRKMWIESKLNLFEKRRFDEVREFLNSENKVWLFGEIYCVGGFDFKMEGVFRSAQSDGVVVNSLMFNPKKFYKAQLEKYLENKLDSFADLIGVRYEVVKVKKLKSKWGSCSNKGRLVFNSCLAKCPENVIDYVIIHELCHRLEMNHSKRFWDLVTRFCPDWKNVKKWFKVYGYNVLEL